jgi:cell wall assembly regulator SMI1
MNTLTNNFGQVTFADNHFFVTLPNEVSFSFPITGNWRFEQATPEQLQHVELDDEGMHWPDIDEDLSFAGLLRGDWGQHVARRKQFA